MPFPGHQCFSYFIFTDSKKEAAHGDEDGAKKIRPARAYNAAYKKTHSE